MIVGPSYNLQHRAADVQRSVNLYPVTVELPGGKSVAYLDSVPGLREFSSSPVAQSSLLMESGGYLLLENPEGDWSLQKISPGVMVYVPPRYAHRSINTGTMPLVTFFCFRGDAGHDYGTIETKGYRKLLVEKDGKPEIIDNPKWKA